MPCDRSNSSGRFLAFVECAGCGESFPVRSPAALKRAKWCSERCRKAQYAFDPCIDCGAPTSSGSKNGYAPEPRCSDCGTRHAGAEHRALVERLWAEGKTSREIALATGTDPKCAGNLVVKMRGRGYNLPHRRTPEQVERIVSAGLAGLRRKRAAA